MTDNRIYNAFCTACATVGVSTTSKLLVACSGGADSLALLHGLHENGATVAVAHVNHQIDIVEADAAQQLVQQFCHERDIPCYVGTFTVPKLAAESKRGIEETARKVRYTFFAETMAAIGYDYYLTAHTQDDNLETVLLHMLRGCGIGGLRGMETLRQTVHLRPILTISRAEIEAYIKAHNLKCAIDSSNDTCDYTRNRVRHELVPLLREFNPRIDDSFMRLAEVVAAEDDFLQREALKLVYAVNGERYCLRRELLAAPRALQLRAMRELAASARCDSSGGMMQNSKTQIEHKHVLAMLGAIERHSSTQLPGKLMLSCRKGKIQVLPGSE